MSLVLDVCNISSKSATKGTWPLPAKNEGGDTLNIDGPFGETTRSVLEKGRENLLCLLVTNSLHHIQLLCQLAQVKEV